jgi:hypothetical protein
VVISFGGSPLAGPIQVMVLGLALVIALRLRTRGEGWLRLTGVLAAATLVASIVAAALGADRLTVALTAVAVLLVCVGVTVAIGRVLLRRPAADLQTVLGALTIYLLLALLFSALHQFFAAALGQPYVNGISHAADTAAYLYFSVITLTTVGLGDLTPACPAARAVTMAEALVGQLYLVAVVGTVVGNWARPRRAGQSAPSGSTDDDPGPG